MTELDKLRNDIDEIDQKIIALLAKRFKYTEEVGIYKAKNQLNAQDTNRENQQFQKIIQLSEQNGLNPEYASEIYRRIIDIVISRHQELLTK
ncbi:MULTISPECIES: chorismate mutase [unclassified Paenibacillus]|uniref:chorismate mutase n=1 Tax=unclassified Paenibacillus TaxID=185978 RepID=UPI0006F775F5|nr:chorismate mutase [Paenibacillus sp. Soil750]KRE68857.1 chorismate mutase [Paenibacillus sp. Soil750]